MDQNDTRPLEPVRVFIVDDNSGMRRLLRSMLAAFGCARVHAYEAADDALDDLPRLRPDIVLTDYQLDGASTGLDLVSAVRAHANEGLRTTPMIMVTSHTSPSNVRCFINGGVDEVLAKPVSPETLYARIVAVVNTPRPYIQAGDFFGPDRRRAEEPYSGPDRRKRAPDGVEA